MNLSVVLQVGLGLVDKMMKMPTQLRLILRMKESDEYVPAMSLLKS